MNNSMLTPLKNKESQKKGFSGRPVAVKSDFINERWIKRPFLSWQQFVDLRWSFFWSFISGVILRFSFSPFEYAYLSFFSLALFLAQLYRRTTKEGAWLGLSFGLPFFYLNITWLNNLYIFNYFAPLGIAAMGVFLSLTGVIFGALSAPVLRLGGKFRFFFIPALWVGLEYIRSLSELAFPWIYLGHTQVNHLKLIQIADITGVYGITFFIVLVNVFIVDCWRYFIEGMGTIKGLIFKGAITGFFLVGIISYGDWQFRQSEIELSTIKQQKEFKVALIQPGVPQTLKLQSYADPDLDVQLKIQARMVQDLQEGLIKIHDQAGGEKERLPDVYILPESAITHPYFNLVSEYSILSRKWLEKFEAPIFVGANRYIIPKNKPPEEGDMYNSAFLLTPGKSIDAYYYDKVHLVPFGEYGSYFSWIPGFNEKILGIADFSMGMKPTRFSVNNRAFGSVICFESCFPYLFRKNINLGVDWMVVITNDAWYGLSSGARRHQLQSIFRAVEMRRPVVRVANTGISCIIDSWGRTAAKLDLEEGKLKYLTASVPLRSPKIRYEKTIYMQPWGDWFSWLCILYSLVILLIIRVYQNLQESK